MNQTARYFRLLFSFAKFSLASEMAFRWNFLMKVALELLWLVILIIFYRTLFAKTGNISGWTEGEYLFFVGCYYALEGVIESLFLENATEFSELIRKGDLDFYLLKPVDEQFLVSFRKFDWSTAPKVIIGGVLMAIALNQLEWVFDPIKILAFITLFGGGIALAYGFLLALASTSVWLVRNQSLLELWWLFTTLMRYPREIYQSGWAWSLWVFFSVVVPAMLVVSIPAETMVRTIDPIWSFWVVFSAVLVLWASRWFFRRAIRSYRSASS